jgi:hypothetical protein
MIEMSRGSLRSFLKTIAAAGGLPAFYVATKVCFAARVNAISSDLRARGMTGGSWPVGTGCIAAIPDSPAPLKLIGAAARASARFATERDHPRILRGQLLGLKGQTVPDCSVVMTLLDSTAPMNYERLQERSRFELARRVDTLKGDFSAWTTEARATALGLSPRQRTALDDLLTILDAKQRAALAKLDGPPQPMAISAFADAQAALLIEMTGARA